MAQNEVKIRLSVDGGAQVKGELSGAGEQLQKLNSNLVKTAQYGAGLLVLAPTLREMAAGIVTAADAVTTLRSQLALATGSTEKASAAYESLYLIAQKSRTSFTELGATFATISRAGQALGLSQQRLLTVTEAIGNAMAIGGGSAQSMQAALVQLGQGLAAGTLRGDELNSVMEQSPRLAKALADGMDIPIGQLRKLGEQGALTSQMVIAALEKSAPQLAKELASASLTVGQSFTMLSNSATKFIGDADRATGASATLASALKSIAGALDSVGETIRKHDTAFAVIGGALAGAAAVAGVLALGKGLVTLAGAVGTLGTAVMALNPVTLAILGVGVIAGGVMAASNAYDKTAAGIKRLIGKLEGADAELLRLRKALAENPGDIITANYVKELERDTPKRVEALRTLRQELALLNAGSAGSVAEDARLDRGTQAFAERTQRATALTEVMGKLSGVNTDFLKDLQALNASYAAGDTTLAAYRVQVAALIDKEGGGKEMLAKSAADHAKAMEMLEASTTSARDAAKVWADTVTDGQHILAEATSNTDGLTKGQARLQQYLTSSAYAQNSEEMRKIAVATLQAAISAEQHGAALKASAELLKATVDAELGEADSLGKQIAAQKEHNAIIGKTAAEIANLEQIKLSDALATAEQRLQDALKVKADVAVIESITLQVEGLRELKKLKGDGAAAQAIADTAKEASAEWKKTADSLNQSLTDSLFRAFESGKGFGRTLRDSLVNTFKTMVLRPIISAIVSPVASAVAGSLGFSGAASAAGGAAGAVSNIGSLAGLAGIVGSLGTFGTAAGYGASALLGGTGLTALSGSASMIGAGSLAGGLGLAAGVLGPVALAGLAISALMKNKNATLGFGASNASGASDRLFGFGRGTDAGRSDQLQGVSDAVLKSIAASASSFGGSSAGLSVQAATDIDRKGKGSGTIQILANGQRTGGVQTGGTDPLSIAATKLGDAGQLGDWFANNASAAIIAGLQQSGLEARFSSYFNSVAASGLTKEQAEAMLTAAASAKALGESFGSLGGAFTKLQQISVPASQALLSAFGGLEKFTAAVSDYYQAFYSDAERTGIATKQLTASFAQLGYTMPTTRAGFRALVDAQDVTTDSGRRLYTSLLQMSGAFADLVPATEALDTAAEQAAVAAEKAAAVRSQYLSLEERLLTAQGNTAELRRRELAALDPANRALQQRLYDITDATAAAEQAGKLRDAWRSVGDTIADEVARIRGMDGATGTTLAGATSAFALATAQARAGDQGAAATLPELSRKLLELAEANAHTAEELAAARAAVAASLERTAAGAYAIGGNAAASATTALQALLANPSSPLGAAFDAIGNLMTRLVGKVTEAAAPAPVDRAVFDAVVAELKALTASFQDLRAETQATAVNTNKTTRQMQELIDRGLVVRTDADTPLSTVAA